VQIPVLQHQADFLRDDLPWLLTDGGRGSGKTRALAMKLASRASRKGAREGLFRQRLVDLRSTTLKTLLEGDGGMPPVLFPGTYQHNQQAKTIRINGGGEIVYNGLDQGDVSRTFGSTGKASSLNLSGAAFDEAVEMSEANIIQISGGIRIKVDGIPLQRYFACNPGPPSHWIAQRFGLEPGGHPRINHRRIEAPARLNHYLPKEFLDELANLEGVARDRYWLGKWVGSDGLVYDTWDRNIHVCTRDWEPTKTIIGVDFGYTDPFAMVVVHLDHDGRMHIDREHYETGLDNDQVCAIIADAAKGATVYADSADPGMIGTMQRKGVNVRGVKKGPDSIEFGIGLVQTRLRVQGDGKPRLTVDPNCLNTIREFESYERARANDGGMKEKPIDKNNHAMDAIRYAVMEHDKGGGLFVGPAPVKQTVTHQQRLNRWLNDD
jgi:phage terminase large subunit